MVRHWQNYQRYFAITEFNNVVLSFGLRVCLLMNICHFAIFTEEPLNEGEKCGFILILMSRTLFVGHVVGSLPMKRKKNLHQMIIIF